jgi:hypothetical protein
MKCRAILRSFLITWTTAAASVAQVPDLVLEDGGLEFPDGTIQETAQRADGLCWDNAKRYVDCGNGTVTDTAFALLWLKDASCPQLGIDALGRADWAAASAKVAALKHGMCGLSDHSRPGDWRLPTELEWFFAVSRAVALNFVDPALTDTVGTGQWQEGDPFVGVESKIAPPTGQYWSSTGRDNNPGIAATLFLWNGVSVDVAKTNVSMFVWPVRFGR